MVFTGYEEQNYDIFRDVVFFFLILLCLEGETEAVQLPSPKAFLHLISPISSQLAAAQKEVPRNLRDPQADGRLGKREKPRSLSKITAPTSAEAGEPPRSPGRAARPRPGASPSPEREVPLALSDSAQIAGAPRRGCPGDGWTEGRREGGRRQPGSPHRGRPRPRAPSRGAQRDGGSAPERRREGAGPPAAAATGGAPAARPPPPLSAPPAPARPRPPLSEGRGEAEKGEPRPRASTAPLRSPGNAPGSEWAVSGPWLGASSPGQGRGAGAGGGSRAGAAAPHTAEGEGGRGEGGGAGAVPSLGWRPGGLASLRRLSSGPLTPPAGSLRTAPACQGLLK